MEEAKLSEIKRSAKVTQNSVKQSSSEGGESRDRMTVPNEFVLNVKFEITSHGAYEAGKIGSGCIHSAHLIAY